MAGRQPAGKMVRSGAPGCRGRVGREAQEGPVEYLEEKLRNAGSRWPTAWQPGEEHNAVIEAGQVELSSRWAWAADEGSRDGARPEHHRAFRPVRLPSSWDAPHRAGSGRYVNRADLFPSWTRHHRIAHLPGAASRSTRTSSSRSRTRSDGIGTMRWTSARARYTNCSSDVHGHERCRHRRAESRGRHRGKFRGRTRPHQVRRQRAAHPLLSISGPVTGGAV